MEIKRAIIFSKTPLLGCFRFGNIFQIYPPILKGIPISEYQRDCPIVLEYLVTENDKIESPFEFDNFGIIVSKTATDLSKQDQIVSLLTLFTNHFFFRYQDTTGCWGIPVSEGVPIKDKITSSWNIKMFTYPEMACQINIDDFTAQVCDLIPVVKYKEYYYNNPSFDNGSSTQVTIPNIILKGLNMYYVLDNEGRKVINTAIKHINLAFENFLKANSTLAAIASFTAIEAMVNYEYRDFKPDSCESCGQLKYKVAKKYRDYLLKYIGDSEANKRKFNKYYSLRSKIIHAGELFESENLWNDLPKDKRDEENIQLIEILQLSKLSVINWLLRKNENVFKD